MKIKILNLLYEEFFLIIELFVAFFSLKSL